MGYTTSGIVSSITHNDAADAAEAPVEIKLSNEEQVELAQQR